MDEIAIAILYDGEWKNVGGQFSYESGKGKCILVSKTSSFKELHDSICREIDINSSEVTIKMTFKFNSFEVLSPFAVANDRDVKVFFSQQSDVTTRTPLYITLEPKIGNRPGVAVLDEACGKHHYEKTGLESVESRKPVVVETEMANNAVYGLDDVTEGIFDGNGFEGTEVSISPTTNNATTDRVEVNSDKDLNSDAVPPTGSHASHSSRLQVNQSSTIDSLNSVKDVSVGDFFASKEELHLKMKLLAVSRHFQTRVNKSTKDLLVLTCIQKDCKWRLRATKLQGSEAFRVRKYHPDHTCSLDSLHFDHPQATSKLIAHCIKSKYEGTSQCYRPNDIIQDMKKNYGMTCSYTKAWRAREVGMTLARGSPEQSFHILPWYCAMLENKNAGTKTDIETDSSNRFKYFFMALGACIAGFRTSIRPVIAVDGTFLKSKYQGTLFVATSMDGNNQVYPLAFGIGDSENDDAWIWFLTRLRGCIGELNDLVFISDRNTSIAKAITQTFPTALHGICMYHLGQNMKASHKGIDVHDLFYKAAKAFRVPEFNHLMSQIRGVKVEVAQYLLDADPTKWARCHFDGRRYSIMTTNIAECLNAILKEARELPITKLIDHIRGLLQRWFWERREAASKMSTPMTKWVESKLRHRMKKACAYRVHPINLLEYHVIDGYLNPVVNLQDRTCECRKFQLDQLPCSHALAACNSRHISCYDYCSPYYRKETLVAAYVDSIHPVAPADEWIVPDDVDVPTVLPPKGRKPRGRPAKKRILSRGEDKPQRKCGRCAGLGHNRQNCKAPIPLSDRDGPKSRGRVNRLEPRRFWDDVCKSGNGFK